MPKTTATVETKTTTKRVYTLPELLAVLGVPPASTALAAYNDFEDGERHAPVEALIVTTVVCTTRDLGPEPPFPGPCPHPSHVSCDEATGIPLYPACLVCGKTCSTAWQKDRPAPGCLRQPCDLHGDLFKVDGYCPACKTNVDTKNHRCPPWRGICVCNGNDPVFHSHYRDGNHACARCSKCKAFEAVAPTPAPEPGK